MVWALACSLMIIDYVDLSKRSAEATHLMSEISQMQTAITDLKNAQEQANTDQNLPLPESLALLASYKANRDRLAIALERQTQENARKSREVEKLRAQLAEMEQNRVDAEMFAREAERSKNAESLQAEMASKRRVGWWYALRHCFSQSRLKAMTTAQMNFLGLKEFKYNENTQEVSIVMQVEEIGEVPIQIYLKNRKLDSAKVFFIIELMKLIVGYMERIVAN
jgi:hypothetical protein